MPSLAIVHSRANLGMQSPPVTIEVSLAPGLPGMNIVGLPEKAVKESKDRVRIAIDNNGFRFPIGRLVVNLAPADLPKEGGRFDLPIALGILAASEQIPTSPLESYEFIGELALTGELKSVKGVLPMALAASQAHHAIVVPLDNAQEASLCDVPIYAANHLQSVCAHLTQRKLLPRYLENLCSDTPVQPYPDLVDVRGQWHGKRALEIAAAGGHSILFSGPPGTGKTMLASRLPGILPPMTDREAQSTAVVHSISARGFETSTWRMRPFRSPHHTASSVALVGGGSPPKPGEISLAHNGVLFLDELPEFDRHVLEALREPLEAGCVTISRAGRQAQFPSRFQFVAAMNPCPCGYYGDANGRCKCSIELIQRYQNRLSGPLLDRIDMHLTVTQLPPSVLLKENNEKSESSHSVRERVLVARAKQLRRSNCINSQLIGNAVTSYCRVDSNDHEFLEKAMLKLGLSARAFHRILKLSRTIADLDNSDLITQKHLQEALSYRRVSVI